MLSRAVKLTFFLCFLSCCYASAGAQSWHRFSPPRRELVIELPQKPKAVRSKEREMMPSLFPHTTAGFSYSVDLIPGDQPELIFGALNLSKRLSNRRFDDIVNSNILWIDGDDKHFSKEADVTVAGLHGREFVYNKGVMSGRTLFLNGVNRVYFLLYSTESDAGSADVVNRIFSSFRPLRRGRRRAKRNVVDQFLATANWTS